MEEEYGYASRRWFWQDEKYYQPAESEFNAAKKEALKIYRTDAEALVDSVRQCLYEGKIRGDWSSLALEEERDIEVEDLDDEQGEPNMVNYLKWNTTRKIPGFKSTIGIFAGVPVVLFEDSGTRSRDSRVKVAKSRFYLYVSVTR